MSKAPVVTGISPIEGVPGTKVIIRGENFGSRPEDLIGLTICGVDCLMTAEWKTSNKIIARNVAGNGKGDIIVTTIQGARGTSTVQFKGYQETMGLLKESAVWVDETIFLNMAFGRKRPMSPTSALQEDPLGLSVEGNDRKVLNEDLEEMFPGCSGDLSSTKFNPEWFLLENHYSTSYDDLRAGLAYLRRKVETQKMGQISFLKTNVGSVLEQLDTLLELKCKFESDIQEHGRNITQVLEKSIIECKEEADKLFEDVLQRKDRADGTRNALNVLHRFRFLLYLPVNIERHIQRGDYDVVINDYARAKSLFGDTQVPLFRRFYSEVEKRIDDLRRVLGEQLTRMPSSLEHQKKIIRNLHHLETPGDPAWQCLTAQHDYILHLLISVRDNHLNREMADHDLGSGGGKMGVGGSRHSTPAAKYNKIMMSSVGEWQATAPVRVLWVEEACDVLSTNFPDMWKLSQAYFGGELLPPSAQVDHLKHPRCKEMIMELLHVYSGLMRGAIMPHSLDPTGPNFRNYHVWPEASPDQITPWLPQVLRHVRGCYSALLTQDLPNDALDVIKDLILDLRVHCLTSLFQQTVEHVRSLHTREKWNLEVDDENGGCTQLPHICENVIVECAQLVRETVLESGPRETPLLDHPTVHRDIITLIHNVIVAFAQSLEKLSQVSLHDPDEDDGDCNISENAPGVEAQLLITLSNCAFMRRTILPRLSDSLVRASYPQEAVKEAIDQASGTYSELQDRLFEAYLEERVDPIIGMIERSMYLGQYDWGKVEHPPTDVRTYVKEILINITHVHAEVVGVWPGLVGGLVGRVVEGVGEEMSRLITCVSHWSRAGTLQAHIDLDALTSVLRNHMSQAASGSFHEAREILPKLTSAEEREKEEVLRRFRTNMRFLLACFVEVESLNDNTTTHSIV